MPIRSPRSAPPLIIWAAPIAVTRLAGKFIRSEVEIRVTGGLPGGRRAAASRRYQPPSIPMAWPVTNPASSDAR
jgi:hypothetical protein